MKVAYLVDTYPRDSEAFIEREIGSVRQKNVEIDIFSICKPADPDQDVTYLLDEKGRTSGLRRPTVKEAAISALTIASMFDKHPLLLVARLRRSALFAALARKISDGEYDMIHAHFLGIPSTAGLVASRLSGLPFTISAHASDIFCTGEGLLRKSRAARAIFVCSRANAQSLIRKGVPRNKVIVSYHGVPDGNSPAKKKKAVPLILSGGRFVEKKGFTHLVSALKQLRHENVEFKCVIFGDGPLKKVMAEQVRVSGLGGRTIFPGWLTPEALRELYAEADVFVCPSVIAANGDRDGVPNVVLEAMASHVPVVAFDTGGIPEAVISGVTGIFPQRGNVSALAESVQLVLRDRELSRNLRSGAAAHVTKNFNLARNTQILVDAWGDILTY